MSKPDSFSVYVDLMRHGEPQGGQRYRGGRIDDPLSDRGWSQMWEAVGDKTHWHKIITSPMQRCLAFAESLSEKNGLPLSIESRFTEVGFGAWEGRTKKEILDNNKEEYEAFYRDPVNNRPSGAEVLTHFIKRVAEAYDEIIASCGGENILIIAHAGVIRAVITHALGNDPKNMYQLKVSNASITCIKHMQDKAAGIILPCQ